MQFVTNHKLLSILGLLLLVVVAVLLWQVLYIKYHGTAVLAPTIPRGTEQFGTKGSQLQYVVMGDSTSIGQGADYSQGIARQTASYLAQSHRVSLTNVGVSGATVADVTQHQLAKAAALKPDVVLLAIGANDVTHLTSPANVQPGIANIVRQLQAANPQVRVVLTGSPAMGSVPRFAALTQVLARSRTLQVNKAIAAAVQGSSDPQNIVLVPLAAKTEATFLAHPEYFAKDNFHPNATGYAVWFPTLDAGFAQLGL